MTDDCWKLPEWLKLMFWINQVHSLPASQFPWFEWVILFICMLTDNICVICTTSTTSSGYFAALTWTLRFNAESGINTLICLLPISIMILSVEGRTLSPPFSFCNSLVAFIEVSSSRLLGCSGLCLHLSVVFAFSEHDLLSVLLFCSPKHCQGSCILITSCKSRMVWLILVKMNFKWPEILIARRLYQKLLRTTVNCIVENVLYIAINVTWEKEQFLNNWTRAWL